MPKNLTDLDMETLIEFANNNMDVSKTARQMFMSRSATAYHLDKIKRVTGLNPYNFFDLVKLFKLYSKNILERNGDSNECN